MPRFRSSAAALLAGVLLACQTTTAPKDTKHFLRLSSVSAGETHSCGVRWASVQPLQPGIVVCWGTGPLGRVPEPSLDACAPAPYCVPFPETVFGGELFTTVAASGARLDCALAVNQYAWCWGEIDSAGSVIWSSAVPESLPTTVQFAALGSGLAHVCGLSLTGAAYCWGSNDDGELGTGIDRTQLAVSRLPVAVARGMTFTALAVGAHHACARTTDSTAFCWGANGSGQLGNDTIAAKAACGTAGDSCSWFPVAVTGALKLGALAAGRAHTCAIAANGGLYCWGQNDLGQTATSDTSSHCGVQAVICRPVPVATGFPLSAADSGIVDLSAGGSHACALVAGGRLYCWGDNQFGELGLGNTSGAGCLTAAPCRPVPTYVSILTAVVAVSAGADHTCALTAGDGAVFCWGRNAAGQLGTGKRIDSSLPVRLADVP
jgi:hypothetical protein